ncbi:hypothetical protein [Streptomyces alboflavus]|uniref:hypothetical protein n=1 Tax=Streptomyces alboflavus TaxID=67267 RepID=UPI00369CD6CC
MATDGPRDEPRDEPQDRRPGEAQDRRPDEAEGGFGPPPAMPPVTPATPATPATPTAPEPSAPPAAPHPYAQPAQPATPPPPPTYGPPQQPPPAPPAAPPTSPAQPYGTPELLEPPATPRAPAPDPGPPEPLRPLAAALLNLTGLGLGYVLIRAWIPAALCWVATAALLLVALPADVDGVPGGALLGYVVVLALAAADAARRARRTPIGWRLRAPLAAGLGIVLLAVPASGALAYDSAQDEAVEEMLLDRLDKADRLVKAQEGRPFTATESEYRDALGTYRDLVRDHAGSRAADRVPDRLDTYYKSVAAPYADRQYCEAIEPLKYLRTLPDSLGKDRLGRLATWPDNRLADSFYACGMTSLGKTGGGSDLRELMSTFPESDAAAKVVPGIRAAIDERADELTGPDPCSATTELRAIRTTAETLPGETASSLRAKAAGTIRSGSYACGVDDFKDGRYTEAAKTLSGYADTYKDSGRAKRARTIAIAAEVAAARPQAGGKLPAQRGPGSGQEFVIKNDGPSAVEVLFTGPATGSVKLGPCLGCTTYSSRTEGRAKACKASGRSYPQKTLRLPAGEYHFLYKRGTGAGNLVRDHSDGAKVQGGYRYTDCAYVVRGGFGDFSPRT